MNLGGMSRKIWRELEREEGGVIKIHYICVKFSKENDNDIVEKRISSILQH